MCPSASIVFVHGLQGHPQKTWEWESRGRPSEFLTPDAGTQARAHHRWIPFGRSRSSSADRTLHERETKAESHKDVDGGMEGSVFWPLDLLPSDCPDARILTFGYDTHVTKGFAPVDKSNIFSHGRDLLYALARERREKPPSGLVFVAHSLGGIIVKEVSIFLESHIFLAWQGLSFCYSCQRARGERIPVEYFDCLLNVLMRELTSLGSPRI